MQSNKKMAGVTTSYMEQGCHLGIKQPICHKLPAAKQKSVKEDAFKKYCTCILRTAQKRTLSGEMCTKVTQRSWTQKIMSDHLFCLYFPVFTYTQARSL